MTTTGEGPGDGGRRAGRRFAELFAADPELRVAHYEAVERLRRLSEHLRSPAFAADVLEQELVAEQDADAARRFLDSL